LENLVIGISDPNTIYLIDFGLASKFKDKRGTNLFFLQKLYSVQCSVHLLTFQFLGEDIEKFYTGKFRGNFLFASRSAFKGNSRSRRDDV